MRTRTRAALLAATLALALPFVPARAQTAIHFDFGPTSFPETRGGGLLFAFSDTPQGQYAVFASPTPLAPPGGTGLGPAPAPTITPVTGLAGLSGGALSLGAGETRLFVQPSVTSVSFNAATVGGVPFTLTPIGRSIVGPFGAPITVTPDLLAGGGYRETLVTITYAAPSFAAFVVSAPGGVLIDNLALVAVPEPATVALLGGGLLALAGVARRRVRVGG